MGQITDVVKHLLIINVIVYIAKETIFSRELANQLALYYPGDSQFKPFQIVAHMFMHGSTTHIFMNMMGLFFLGPTVEKFIGSKNFFILYFACGLGAVVLRSLVQYTGFIPSHIPAVGASGAVVGVVSAFATIFPHQKLYMMFIPVPIKAMYMMSGLVAFDLYCGLTNTMSGVAHFAHIGGAIVGFLMAWFWFKKYNFRR